MLPSLFPLIVFLPQTTTKPQEDITPNLLVHAIYQFTESDKSHKCSKSNESCHLLRGLSELWLSVLSWIHLVMAPRPFPSHHHQMLPSIVCFVICIM